MDITKNLINAMIEYGEGNCWEGWQIIETLVEIGLDEDDFVQSGFGEFYNKEITSLTH